MRNILLAALIALSPSLAFAQRASCNADYTAPSPLCEGLAAFYDFELNASDKRAFDTFGYIDLEEPGGVDVAQTAAGKLGSYAALFDSSTKYYRIPNSPSLGNGWWTVAVWVYPTTLNADNAVLSKWSSTQNGTYITVTNTGAQVGAFETETSTQYAAIVNGALTTSNWHLLVTTLSPANDGYAKLGMSVDGGAFTYTTVSKPIQTNLLDLRVGQYCDGSAPFTGRIDGLLFSSKVWDATEVALYWNNGAGRNFPF